MMMGSLLFFSFYSFFVPRFVVGRKIFYSCSRFREIPLSNWLPGSRKSSTREKEQIAGVAVILKGACN